MDTCQWVPTVRKGFPGGVPQPEFDSICAWQSPRSPWSARDHASQLFYGVGFTELTLSSMFHLTFCDFEAKMNIHTTSPSGANTLDRITFCFRSGEDCPVQCPLPRSASNSCSVATTKMFPPVNKCSLEDVVTSGLESWL